MASVKTKEALVAGASLDSTTETLHRTPPESVSKALHGYQLAEGQMRDGVSKAMKYWQEYMAFGQGNMAALMQSSRIMTAGLQEISKHVAETGKANIEQSVALSKSIFGAKSVKEAAELQPNYVKATLQTSLAQSRDLAEATTKLSKQVAQPFAERAALSGNRILEK